MSGGHLRKRDGLRFSLSPACQPFTLSLHDALPISGRIVRRSLSRGQTREKFEDEIAVKCSVAREHPPPDDRLEQQQRRHRSEEHTSELQSHSDLVCRLLLEKNKKPLGPKRPVDRRG